MNVTTISVTYGRKVNLGDYNSANVECSIWAQLDPGEDTNEAAHALWSMAKENVKAQVLPLNAKDAKNIKTEEMFLGLPIKKEIE
jgi:hypothetical protein